MPAVLVTPPTAAQAVTELAVSSLMVAETTAITHCAYPRRNGQAELAWVAGYITRWYTHPETITHPSTNRAQRSITSLICPTALLQCQTSEWVL